MDVKYLNEFQCTQVRAHFMKLPKVAHMVSLITKAIYMCTHFV